MGSVYEARGADGNIVALKVLSPLLAAEPALRERFRREARALAAISHPGVVKMLGEGEENSFCWYAMERITGSDLRETLKSGPLTASQVIGLAKTMLEALEVVHAAGFIHRDVKPSNILISAEGPKLCDFGIARLEGASTLTESAALLGSLRYMAPEQRWGKSDTRSDLYALGVVMHEALALGVPGEKPLPSSTPASLVRLIAKLTETNAALRPQSAAEAKRLLLASSRAPAVLGLAALTCLAVAGVFVYVLPFSAEDGGLAVDAGTPVALLDVPDAATSVEPPDAGLLALSAPDAGMEKVGGLLAELGPDAGSTSPFDDTAGTAGTKGGISTLGTKGATKIMRGKPTQKPLPVEPEVPEPTVKSKKPSKKPSPKSEPLEPDPP